MRGATDPELQEGVVPRPLEVLGRGNGHTHRGASARRRGRGGRTRRGRRLHAAKLRRLDEAGAAYLIVGERDPRTAPPRPDRPRAIPPRGGAPPGPSAPA